MNRRRRRKRKQGGKEVAILAVSVVALVAALAWRVPAEMTEYEIADAEPITTMPQTTEQVSTEASIAETQEETAEAVQTEPERTYVGKFTVTAYCPCAICCGEWANNRPDGIVYTASGSEAKEGVTVGAAWEVLPEGTHIEIDGLGERIVQDCPADWIIERYDGMIIDAFFETHEAALEYGKQTVDVWIIEDGKEE